MPTWSPSSRSSTEGKLVVEVAATALVAGPVVETVAMVATVGGAVEVTTAIVASVGPELVTGRGMVLTLGSSRAWLDGPDSEQADAATTSSTRAATEARTAGLCTVARCPRGHRRCP